MEELKERMPSIRLVIGGHARHGKDEVCEMLNKLTGWKFQSSSQIAADEGIFDDLIAEEMLYDVYGMSSYETGRSNLLLNKNLYRSEMFDAIQEYNTPDKTRLMKTVFEESSMYCGIRCREEFLAAKHAGIFDLSIWVDGSERVKAEHESSITVLRGDFDIILDNNGTIHELFDRIYRLVPFLIYADSGKQNSIGYAVTKH